MSEDFQRSSAKRVGESQIQNVKNIVTILLVGIRYKVARKVGSSVDQNLKRWLRGNLVTLAPLCDRASAAARPEFFPFSFPSPK